MLGGPAPTFAEHLASADGAAELRKLRAHVDAQVQAELGERWKPRKRTPGSFFCGGRRLVLLGNHSMLLFRTCRALARLTNDAKCSPTLTGA